MSTILVNTPLYQQSTLLPVETTAAALGALGEALVMRALGEQGYRLLRHGLHHDLEVATPDGEILTVEVKTARRDSQGKWQFCLFKAKHTDHRGADWVVLLVVLSFGAVVPYVVPGTVLTARNVAFRTHPDRYAGQLKKYRQSINGLLLVVH